MTLFARRFVPTLAWLTLLVAAPLAFAQALVDGEVTKVDVAKSMITLQHNAVPNLDLPAMKMAYKVKDPAHLAMVQVGDRVKFSADKIGGHFTIVTLTKAP